MDNIIDCVGLTKRYGAHAALQNLELHIPRGKIVGLLGPNGSGKTTLIKICAGLLQPSAGTVLIGFQAPGPESKALVSYLPERPYFAGNMHIYEMLDFFCDFYGDFDRQRAQDMLRDLSIDTNARFNTLSKGTKEKVQLILVMSRRASLYLLDEPIAGVDPAARDYILRTILTNYDHNATILISTHLISDIESVLDEFIFIRQGEVLMHDTAENVRVKEGKSIDELFREVFRC